MKHKPKSLAAGKSKPSTVATQAERVLSKLEEPITVDVDTYLTWEEKIGTVSPNEIAHQETAICELRVRIFNAKEQLLNDEFRLGEYERVLVGMKRSLAKLAQW